MPSSNTHTAVSQSLTEESRMERLNEIRAMMAANRKAQEASAQGEKDLALEALGYRIMARDNFRDPYRAEGYERLCKAFDDQANDQRNRRKALRADLAALKSERKSVVSTSTNMVSQPSKPSGDTSCTLQ
jgi:hypothetical protein